MLGLAVSWNLLALHISTSSTGTIVIRKDTSNTNKRITTAKKKREKKAGKVSFMRSIIVDE